MLQALRETDLDESELPHLFILIDPDRNYAVYRKTYAEKKGLPFLPPHIRQLKTYQQQAVLEMVPAGAYEKSMNSTQAQAVEQQELPLDMKQPSWNTIAWFYITHHISCIAAGRKKRQIGGAPRHT